MSNSILARNVVIEVAEVTGEELISNTTQTGTNTVTTYNTTYEYCVDDNQSEQAFRNPNTHVYYKGSFFDMNYTTFGDTGYQGCDMSQVTCGLTVYDDDINKCIGINLFKDSAWVSSQFQRIPPYSPGLSTPYKPYNSAWEDYNVQGRCLYMMDTTTSVRTGYLFDVVDAVHNDMLLVKGNGEDFAVDISFDFPKLFNGDQDFDWYVSAYQHMANWDTSSDIFNWTSNAESIVMSYHGNKNWQTTGGYPYQASDCFENNGYLGLRSTIFDHTLPNATTATWELSFEINSLVNATIEVFDGNNVIEIDSVGTFRQCILLRLSDEWGGASGITSGGVSMDTSWHDVFNGGVTLLNARSNDPSQQSSATIEKVSIIKKITVPTTTSTTTVTPVFTTTPLYEVPTYEWKRIDVLESSAVPLSLNFSVGDLRDITKRANGYSKTFNIPASIHNNTVLTPLLAVGSERDMNNENSMISWVKSRIKVNGVYVFQGLMRVEEGNTGNGGYYKCHIIQDTIDWSLAIGDKTICELEFGEETPADKTYTSITNSWGNSPDNGDDYFYGLVNYGEWYAESVNTTSTTDYTKSVNDFHPAVFAKPMVDKIFNGVGYTLESNFFNSDTFKKLCHPYSSGEDYTDTEGLFGNNGDNYCRVTRTAKVAPAGSYNPDGKIPYPCMTCNSNYADWYPLNSSSAVAVSNDLGNNFSTNTSVGYTVPFSGTYHVFIGATLYIKQSGSSGSYSELAVRVLRNGSYLVGGVLTPNVSPQIGINSGCFVWSDQSNVVNGLSRSSDGDFFLDAGDNITVQVIGRNGVWLWNSWHDVQNLVFDIYPIPSSTIPPTPVILTGENLLPCTKQMDYLKGLTEMFNLQWTANEETKVVSCEPYEDFFGSGKTLNWTDKLDHKSWNDKYIVEQLAKEITFEYREDTGDKIVETVYDWLEANDRDVYKSHTETNEEKFRKESLSMGTQVFSSTIQTNSYGKQPSPSQHSNGSYGWGDGAWNDPQTNPDNPLMPIMWNESGGSINGTNRPPYNSNPKFNIRILNYYGKANCSTYKFSDENGVLHTKTTYPHLGWQNMWLKGVAPDPYSLHWGDVDDNYGNVSPGLFTKYWRIAYDKMNGGAALRTCMMDLSAVDIAIFDYRDLIHMEIDAVSTYWTVNKIIDYKPNQNKVTKVELIEWKTGKDANRRGGETKKHQDQEPRDDATVKETKGSGLVLNNNTNSKSSGNGIALGVGVIAKDNQTVLGRYNSGNSTDVLQIGSGISPRRRSTALAITESGEIEIHGGELVVDEITGEVHDLVYTDDDGDIKKLYLKKKEVKQSINNITNGNYNI